MCRPTREKIENGIYHIMIRSISELNIFEKDIDKEKYLYYLNQAQKEFKFKIYSFCLMTNHAHFIIDSCGADISKIMHKINLRFAMFFNRKYDRHGHVFQDRFKSKIVTNEKYLLVLSSYIHNNPKDIPMFSKQISNYKYSSLGIFLGTMINPYNIVEPDYVLQFFSKNINKARIRYINFIKNHYNLDEDFDFEFVNEKGGYKSERVYINRKHSADSATNFTANYFQSKKENLFVKYNKSLTKFRAISIYIMHIYCNLTFKEICSYIGNITLSQISRLHSEGIKIIDECDEYKDIGNKFIAYTKSAA